jgi:hypothetical protein
VGLPQQQTQYKTQNIMATKPLQSLNFGQPVYESEGLTIASLRANIGNKNEAYDFKGSVFQCEIPSMTAVKEGDSLFLVGTSVGGNVGTSFDLDCKEYKEGKSVTDKPKSEAAFLAWAKSLYPTVIDTKGIDSLEVIATVAAENSITFFSMNNDQQKFHTFKMKEGEKAEAIQKLSEAAFAWIAGYEENPLEPWKAKPELIELTKWLGERGLIYLPIMDVTQKRHEGLQQNIGSAFMPEIVYLLPPLKTVATSPHDGVKIAMPEIKKSGGGSWGGKSESTAEALAAREKWFLGQYAGLESSPTTLAQLYDQIKKNGDKSQAYFDFLCKVAG